MQNKDFEKKRDISRVPLREAMWLDVWLIEWWEGLEFRSVMELLL